MTRLTDEQRRLRALTPAQLADAVGQAKAAAAKIEEQVAALKDEAVRRKLREADGELFRITLSEPGMASRFDRKGLRAKYPTIEREFTYEEPTDWVLRCNARRQAVARAAAA